MEVNCSRGVLCRKVPLPTGGAPVGNGGTTGVGPVPSSRTEVLGRGSSGTRCLPAAGRPVVSPNGVDANDLLTQSPTPGRPSGTDCETDTSFFSPTSPGLPFHRAFRSPLVEGHLLVPRPTPYDPTALGTRPTVSDRPSCDVGGRPRLGFPCRQAHNPFPLSLYTQPPPGRMGGPFRYVTWTPHRELTGDLGGPGLPPHPSGTVPGRFPRCPEVVVSVGRTGTDRDPGRRRVPGLGRQRPTSRDGISPHCGRRPGYVFLCRRWVVRRGGP